MVSGGGAIGTVALVVLVRLASVGMVVTTCLMGDAHATRNMESRMVGSFFFMNMIPAGYGWLVTDLATLSSTCNAVRLRHGQAYLKLIGLLKSLYA